MYSKTAFLSHCYIYFLLHTIHEFGKRTCPMEYLVLHFLPLQEVYVTLCCIQVIADGWLGCLRGFQGHFVQFYFSEGNATSVPLLLAIIP